MIKTRGCSRARALIDKIAASRMPKGWFLSYTWLWTENKHLKITLVTVTELLYCHENWTKIEWKYRTWYHRSRRTCLGSQLSVHVRSWHCWVLFGFLGYLGFVMMRDFVFNLSLARGLTPRLWSSSFDLRSSRFLSKKCPLRFVNSHLRPCLSDCVCLHPSDTHFRLLQRQPLRLLWKVFHYLKKWGSKSN